MPQKTWTVDEAKALAGADWTPALEARLRAQGKIVDPQAPAAPRRQQFQDEFSGTEGYQAINTPEWRAEVAKNPEDPATNALRGMAQSSSLGMYNPAPGVPWGTSLPAIAGRSIGSGVGSAGWFAATAPVAAAVGGVGALGWAAKPLGAGAQMALVNAMQTAGGKMSGNTPEVDAGEAAQGVGSSLVSGSVMAAPHAIPSLSALYSNPVTGPAMDTATMAGVASLEQLIRGEPVTFKENLVESAGTLLGFKVGNAAAGKVMPERWSMTAKQRQAADVAARAKEIAAEEAPVKAAREAAIAKYGHVAQAVGKNTAPPAEVLALPEGNGASSAEIRNPRTVRRRGRGGMTRLVPAVDQFGRVVLEPAGVVRQINLPERTYTSTEEAARIVAERDAAVAAEQQTNRDAWLNDLMGTRVDPVDGPAPANELWAMQRGVTRPRELSRETGFGAPEQPVNWDQPAPAPMPPAGTLVDAAGRPAPSVAQPVPVRPVEILDATGTPARGPQPPAGGSRGYLRSVITALNSGSQRPTGDLNSNFMGAGDIYEAAVGKIKGKIAQGRAARDARVETEARALADRIIAGERVPGLEDASALLGFTFSDPAAKPDGAGGWDPTTGKWTFSPIDGVRLSVPLSQYLNTQTGKSDRFGAAKSLVEEINANPELLMVDDAVLAQASRGEVGSIGTTEAHITDRGRLWRKGTGGRYGNALYRGGLELQKLTERAREKLDNEFGAASLDVLNQHGIGPNTYEGRQGVGRLMSIARESFSTIEQVAQTPEGKAILAKSANPDAMIAAANGLKEQFNTHADLRNGLNEAMDKADVLAGRKGRRFQRELQELAAANGTSIGQAMRTPEGKAIMDKALPKTRKMGIIEQYFPRVERQYSMRGIDPNTGKMSWAELGRALEQWSRPEKRGITDPRSTNVWSAREQHSGAGVLKDSQINYNVYDVLTNYTMDTARVLSNRMAINAGRNIADAIESRAAAIRDKDPQAARDLTVTADAIRFSTDMAYNGKTKTWLENAAASKRGTKVALRGVQAMKYGFQAARYTVNLAFMTLTQPTSVFMVGAVGNMTPDMVARALREYGTARIGAEWNNSYTGWVKSQRGGSLRSEGTDVSVSRREHPLEAARRGRAGRIGKKIGDVVDAPTQWIENGFTGRLVYAMAEQIGIKEGLSGQRLRDFASDMVGQSQSYFDRMNRAPILSDPFINTALPAQGFTMDVANTIASASQGVAGARHNLKPIERADRIVRIASLLYISNLMNSIVSSTDENQVAGGMKDSAMQTVGGLAPYLGQGLGINSYRSQGTAIYPVQFTQDMKKAAEYAGNNDWSRAFSTMANDIMPGGTQIKRIMEADRMVAEGKITEAERLQGQLYGWARTPSGRAYLRKIKEAEDRRKGGKRKGTGTNWGPTPNFK